MLHITTRSGLISLPFKVYTCPVEKTIFAVAGNHLEKIRPTINRKVMQDVQEASDAKTNKEIGES